MSDTRSLVPVSVRSYRDGLIFSGWILSFFLLVGCAAGTAFAGRLYVDSSAAELFSLVSERGAVSFFWDLVFISWPCFAAVFLASSLVGFLVFPVLFFFRGFFASAGVAILLRCGLDAVSAVLVIGLPALFSFCAFFAVGEDAFVFSRDLFNTIRGKSGRRASFISSERLIFAAVFLLISAALRQFAVPLFI